MKKSSQNRISKNPLLFDTSLSIKIKLLTDQILAPGNLLYGIPKSMSIKEWQIIAVLAKFGQMTNKELCKYMKHNHVSISRAVKKLKKELIIESEPSEKDRRNVEIQLTEKGLALHDEIAPKRIKLSIDIDNGLTPEERIIFSKLIYKLDNHIQSLNTNPDND